VQLLRGKNEKNCRFRTRAVVLPHRWAEILDKITEEPQQLRSLACALRCLYILLLQITYFHSLEVWVVGRRSLERQNHPENRDLLCRRFDYYCGVMALILYCQHF